MNTDSPEEALSVNGNIQVTGQILQPSDMRLKTDIMQVRINEKCAMCKVTLKIIFSVEYNTDA